MKSFDKLAAISAIAGAVSAQTTTLTGYGIGPTNYGSTSENQTLFEISNAHPNFTKSASITADTSLSETWDWAVNVTDILTDDSNHTINTVISLTWPQQSTANSVCAIAINAAPTYKTNPGDDASCTDVLSGCLDDLTTAVSKGMVSSDGTSQCGTAFSNISVPSTCTSFFSGSSVNVSASPLGNLQPGKAWLYSATIGASPSLDDSATRVWPLFLMHSAGANITSFANPVCLQAEASKSASATSSGTASATGTAATATSTKKSGAAEATVGKGLVLSAVGLAMMVLMV